MARTAGARDVFLFVFVVGVCVCVGAALDIFGFFPLATMAGVFVVHPLFGFAVPRIFEYIWLPLITDDK